MTNKPRFKKLTKADIEALEHSIKRYENLARYVRAGRTISPTKYPTGGNCKLCTLYRDLFSASVCDGCPVSVHTGQIGCRGTPYEDYAGVNRSLGVDIRFIDDDEAQAKRAGVDTDLRGRLVRRLRAERDFLKLLLENGAKPAARKAPKT